MDYIAPLNRPATVEEPRPAYFDGNAQTGQEGSYPSGRSIEYPQREILAVIENAGLVPSNGDLTQLWQAIQAAIAAALSGFDPGEGGGAPADFSLMPIFPHATVGGGILSVIAGTGSVAVAAGQTFVHRGGALYNSTDTDEGDRTFTTAASKTYHLRWRYNAGTPAFGLFDLADGGYNPTSAAETNAGFDSSYDDMLIARVVTNAANVPTVTALKNLHRLAFNGILQGTAGVRVGSDESSFSFKQALNWARSPDRVGFYLAKAINNGNVSDADFCIFAPGLPSSGNNPPSIPLTRYGLDAVVLRDYSAEIHMNFSVGA